MPGIPFDHGRSTTRFNSQKSRRWSSSDGAINKKLPEHETRIPPNASEVPGTLGDVTFIRLPEVKAVTGLSKTSIYELIRAKSFPAPVRLGPRSVAWVKAEIREWAVERVQASRSAA
jgi:predicted DNA-binding transcriptional regulator AlpA